MKTVQDKNLLEMPIGVFDSGMGGLTVMREIMRQIPNEKVIYFGDTARVPYGSKSKETVTRFSRQIVRFLQSKQVKAIVVACNTASAYALDDLEKDLEETVATLPSGQLSEEQKNEISHRGKALRAMKAKLVKELA